MPGREEELESVIREMRQMLVEEREQRLFERQRGEKRIAELEAQIAAGAGGFSTRGGVQNGVRGGTPSPRAASAGGSPNNNNNNTPAGQRGPRAVSASNERAGSTDGRNSTVKTVSTAPSASKFSKKSSNGTVGSDAKGTPGTQQQQQPPMSPEVATAAQHAWDKLCALVRDDFTVKELYLISLETLRDLLRHYQFDDPIECAQIECQWALYQDGKEKVERPTPKRAPPPRARPFEPAKHSGDFDLRVGPGAPTLSRRNLLAPEGERSSDPNSVTQRGRSVSPGSKGAVKVDPIQGSNPNDSHSPCRDPRGKRVWQSSPTNIHREEYAWRGKSRAHSPAPEAVSPYPNRLSQQHPEGVKRFSQQGQTPESKHRGLKTGYPSPSPRDRPQGLKPVSSGGGPVQWNL